MKSVPILTVCLFLLPWQLKAQKHNIQSIDGFLSEGTFRLTSKQGEVNKEIAHSIEFHKWMYWIPGKDLDHTQVSKFNATGHIFVTEGDAIFLNLMIPSFSQGMNIKVKELLSERLAGELIEPDYTISNSNYKPTKGCISILRSLY
jgi:hypothetical protein